MAQEFVFQHIRCVGAELARGQPLQVEVGLELGMELLVIEGIVELELIQAALFFEMRDEGRPQI